MGEMSLDVPWYQPQGEDLIGCAGLPGVFLSGSSPASVVSQPTCPLSRCVSQRKTAQILEHFL